MGVRGLSSFFDMNPELSKPHQLYNTRVVIDGNNLLNVLYFTFKVDCTYGGDYNRFAAVIKKYFSSYLICNIVPIVIFDGGYDKTDRKLHTTIERARNRLGLVKYVAKHGSSSKVLPVLAINVFKDVLEEMNITYAQCKFEADDQITAIANYYHCPVISQDSDFYIFEIFGGFIRLDSVEITVQSNKNDEGEDYSFLSCTIYHIDDFLSFFPGIEKNILPLFSTLIGNDFVHISTFDSFFMNIKLPKIKSKKLKISKRHQRMIGLLAWLQNHNLSDGIEEVLRHLKKEKRNSVKELIRQTVEGYNVPISNLVNYLDGVQLNNDVCKDCLFSFKGNALPGWFVKNFQEGSISPFLLNAVGLRRVFLMSQIEDIALPSTYNCSLPIRKVLYGLLLSLDGISGQNTSDSCIEEYDRHEGMLQKSLVKPVISVEGFGNLPTLSEVQLDSKCGKLLISCTLEEQNTDVQGLPSFLELLVLCIRYWLKNCHPKPTDSFVDALLLTVLFLSTAEPCVVGKVKTLDTSFVDYEKVSSDCFEKASICDVIEKITMPNINFFLKHMKKYFQKPVHNCGKNIILSIVHSYNQLQSCLFSVLLLNELLDSPFGSPEIHHLLSGTLIYNLTREIRTRRVPELFISETVGRDSAFDCLFQKLKHRVLGDLPADCLKKEDHYSGEKKKKKKHLQTEVPIGNSATSKICTEESDYTDISNKFEFLSLSDCD